MTTVLIVCAVVIGLALVGLAVAYSNGEADKLAGLDESSPEWAVLNEELS